MLSVTTPPTLSNGSGDGIAFSQISWVSGGNSDTGTDIPSGTFVGGTQTLTSYPVNSWREQCLTFSYANAAIVAAGTYNGRAVYTLSEP